MRTLIYYILKNWYWNIVKKNNYFFDIYTYQDYNKLLEEIIDFNYIILDVLLEDLTGIQLAK